MAYGGGGPLLGVGAVLLLLGVGAVGGHGGRGRRVGVRAGWIHVRVWGREQAGGGTAGRLEEGRAAVEEEEEMGEEGRLAAEGHIHKSRFRGHNRIGA